MVRSPISRGFRTPDSDSVNVSFVNFRVGEQLVDSSFDEEIHWDYETPLSAEVGVDVDLDRFVSSAGFDITTGLLDERFAAHLQWRSTKTNQQGSGYPSAVQRGSNHLSVDIPSELVGGVLELWVSIYLARDQRSDSQSVTAQIKGARLWESPRFKLPLEGIGSRLTMSTRDFKRDGLKPSDAMWKVEVEKDLHLPVELGLSVFINVGNSDGLLLLEKPASPKAKTLANWLDSEIRACMLLELLLNNDPTMIATASFPEGSLGESMLDLLERCFPNSNILDIPRNPSVLLAATHQFNK